MGTKSLSDNHSTACGALLMPNRRLTQATIRSRTISPEMPAVVADQAMISRWQASTANDTRTIVCHERTDARRCDAVQGMEVDPPEPAVRWV
jgi:hypothetical protein